MTHSITSWKTLPGFECRKCGDVARQNPTDSYEWGCARCNGASHSVALNFEVAATNAVSLCLAAMADVVRQG